MNQVSKYPLPRSTMPCDSGSKAFHNYNRVASDPANTSASTVNFRPHLIPASLPQVSHPGTAPSPASQRQGPANRSPVVRDGIMVAVMNIENEDTTTSTGGDLSYPCSNGIRPGWNDKSHCA